MLFTPSRIAGAASLRWFSTASTAASAEDALELLFKQAWKKVVPFIDPSKNHLSFYQSCFKNPSLIPTKISFNGFLPCSKEVDTITVPATTATMTDLKPSVLSLHKGNQTTNYFISSGFVFIHPNSIADIITTEDVPIDRIDPNTVQEGITEFSQRFTLATTDYGKIEAQIGLDVHNALKSSISGGSVSEIRV